MTTLLNKYLKNCYLISGDTFILYIPIKRPKTRTVKARGDAHSQNIRFERSGLSLKGECVGSCPGQDRWLMSGWAGCCSGGSRW